jgi:hypothetical protein
MLVYGDAERREACRDMLQRIRNLLRRAAAAEGIVGHGLLVAALIEAGALAQGIADQAFAVASQIDARSPEADAAMALTLTLARRVGRSWSEGFGEPDLAEIEAVQTALAQLDVLPLPLRVEIKQPEGFAYYALYPEAYWELAAALPRDELRVIGIRSIGTTLAAMVAAATGGALPVTLRPVGDPFGREISASPNLAAELAFPQGINHSHGYVVADEGPGLSGSSFASVARFLVQNGVPLDRIHLLPSHPGDPGPEAGDEVRLLWDTAPRHVRTFDDLVLGAVEPQHRLEHWVSDLIGRPTRLAEVSGGEWRRHRCAREADWAPVHTWQERRKFLAETETGTWLIKFAGLGCHGLATFERARALHQAGFTPEPAGWRHGFLVERWHGSALPLDPVGTDRVALVARLGDYLGFRARAFPAEPGCGASTETLFAMARQNTLEALGEAAASRVDRWRPALDRLETRRRPVQTDNRLHVWEWLDESGRLLKTDAVDHHAGHDLVGPQDIAWDVAGASCELGLVRLETERLMQLIERECPTSLDPELAAFLRPCYLAFQLGYYEMAQAGADVAEKARLAAQVNRYANLLTTELNAL